MPQLQFESLAQSLARLPQVVQSIPDVLRDPAANPLQAAILLSMGVVLVLVVLLSIILIIVRPSPEAEEETLRPGRRDWRCGWERGGDSR